MNRKKEEKSYLRPLPGTGMANIDLNLIASRLLSGDVLLYRPRKPLSHQRKISSATGSPYTHAAIYLGTRLVAEAGFPRGVQKNTLKDSIAGSLCVAVFRTQMGFCPERSQRLRMFVDMVRTRGRFYDVGSALNFVERSGQYFATQLDFLRNNYGLAMAHNEFSEQSFICSALVVACYAVVGIIGPSAQVAYQPQYFSPGHLHRDPTFGWLLGYLVPQGGSIPLDDPLLTHATLWRDNMSAKWW